MNPVDNADRPLFPSPRQLTPEEARAMRAQRAAPADALYVVMSPVTETQNPQRRRLNGMTVMINGRGFDTIEGIQHGLRQQQQHAYGPRTRALIQEALYGAQPPVTVPAPRSNAVQTWRDSVVSGTAPLFPPPPRPVKASSVISTVFADEPPVYAGPAPAKMYWQIGHPDRTPRADDSTALTFEVIPEHAEDVTLGERLANKSHFTYRLDEVATVAEYVKILHRPAMASGSPMAAPPLFEQLKPAIHAYLPAFLATRIAGPFMTPEQRTEHRRQKMAALRDVLLTELAVADRVLSNRRAVMHYDLFGAKVAQ